MFVTEFQKTQARFPKGSRVVSPGDPVRFGVVKEYTLHPRGLVVDVEDATAPGGFRETITHAALWHPATNWPDSGLTPTAGAP